MVYIAVATCPTLVTADHTYVSSTAVEYGSVVLVSCETGYEFSDDVTSLTLECTATGAWSRDISNQSCSSKVLLNNISSG